MAVKITQKYELFKDVDGDPLENGYIYIGTTGLNPEVSPITVYFDEALTLPASQPLRSSGGYIQNAGTPTNIYVDTDYSITVRNKNESLIYTSLSNNAEAGLASSIDTVGDLIGLDEETTTGELDVYGYYTSGDSAGGLFVWDSTTSKADANAGTIIDPSVPLANQGTGIGTGCWIRQYDGDIKLEYFGIVSPSYVKDNKWIWDDTVNKNTANLGTIIDPTVELTVALQGTGSGNGCMIRQYSGAVNVKWFGAKGDTTDDNSPAIKKAIAYLESIGGGVLYCPYSASGYKMLSSVSFKDNITFDGGNNYFITYTEGTYDTSGALITAGFDSSETPPSDENFARNCHITRCKYDGDLGTVSTGRPFFLGYVTYSSVSDSHVQNNPNAFVVRKGNMNTISKCSGKNLSFQTVLSTGKIIIGTETHTLLINNCYSYDVPQCFDIRNTGTVIVSNNIGINCAGFFKNQDHGKATITDNYIVATDTVFADKHIIKVTSSNTIVANNYCKIQNKAVFLIFITDTEISDCIVDSNIVYTDETDGTGLIRFYDGAIKNTTISNNIITVDKLHSSLLLVDTATTDGLIMKGNTFTKEITDINASATKIILNFKDVENAIISDNIFIFNKSASDTGSQKVIYSVGTGVFKDVLFTGNRITGGSTTGGDTVIDFSQKSENCLISNNSLVSTSALSFAIRAEAVKNNLAHINNLNNTWEHTTPTIF